VYVEGVSTRKVKEVTEELCGTSFSKSLVSSLAGSLDSELEAWRDRRLEARAYPYVFVDARYEKVRVDHKVVNRGVLVVSGVRDDGFREVLGVGVADTESEATYQELFRSLKRRGLSGVQLVVSDDHEGLKAAIARHFQGASHQRCLLSITPGTSSAWWATLGARSSGRTSGRSSPLPTENKPSPSPLRLPRNGVRRATRRWPSTSKNT
jgi:transposase-like protein